MKARFLILLLGLSSMAAAQSVLIRVIQGNSLTQVANGGTFTVNSAGAGQAQTFTINITYLGATSLTFTQTPQILGSQDFTITKPPSASVTLSPNQSVTMDVQYLPTSGSGSQAELDYAATEAAATTASTTKETAPLAGSGTTTTETTTTTSPTPRMIAIGLAGTAPEYSLNYKFSVNANVVSLPAGGTIPFIDTPLTSATLATAAIVNRGTGSGQVLSASVTGDAFALISLPILPSTLASGGGLEFQVRYRPRDVGTHTGTLTLTFRGGLTYTVALTGQGISSYLTYTVVPSSGSITTVVPNGTISVPGAAVGEQSTVFVRVKNASSFDITLSTIAISGTGFQLANVPYLSVTMGTGDVQTFSVVFTPTASGQFTGRLVVGGDSFNLAGSGIGPNLTYAYKSPAGTSTVQSLGTVVFPNAQVGGSSTIDFTLKNTGSAPAAITSIGIVSDGKAVFTTSGLPALPAAIAAGSSITFTILFSPLNTGLTSASLRVNNDAFTLSGVALSPEPLPDYTIGGPTAVQALDQPSVSLTLSEAYPVALTGTLTLSSEPDSFASDPSVLFVLGTAVVKFSIPAGTTKAVFSNNATSLKFQAGSVAGTLAMTPTFATEGGLDLTPTIPKTLRMTLAAAAPKLYGVSIGSRTESGFTLQVVGLTTTRSLTKLTVTFKGKAGYNFSVAGFTQDLTAASFTWFNSSSSKTYGGQFMLQIPFSLTTSDTSGSATALVQALESATVTVTNEKDSSNSVTVAF